MDLETAEAADVGGVDDPDDRRRVAGLEPALERDGRIGKPTGL